MTLGKVKWNRALCRSVNQTLPCIRRERLAANPANSAIDDTTVAKLADKHPARPLNFNDQYWPDDEDALEFWRSQEGATALEQKLQHVQHTKVVSVSTSVWRP
jgi:hypothetical protein